MNLEEMQSSILQKFPNAAVEVAAPPAGLVVKIFPTMLDEAVEFIVSDSGWQMDYLMNLTAVDYPPDRIDLVYHVGSLTHRHRLTLKVNLNRDNPKIRSLVNVWRAAEWHEREVYDLFGVEFTGHPDLRRILTPDGLVGFPLRKDWTGPDFIPKPEDYSGKA